MSPAFSRSAAAWIAAARADAVERRGGGHRVRHDAGDPVLVAVAADHTDDGGAVVAPGQVLDRGADDDTRELGGQVLVAELPGALHVDHGDALAGTAGPLPGPVRVDALGCGAQIALAAGEVGRDGGAFLAPPALVGAVSDGPHRGRYGTRFHIRRGDLGQRRDPRTQLLGTALDAAYAVEEPEVGQCLGARSRGLGRRLQPLRVLRGTPLAPPGPTRPRALSSPTAFENKLNWVRVRSVLKQMSRHNPAKDSGDGCHVMG